MKQLRELPGISFEILMEKLFIHRGCPTVRTPATNDFGADLIVTFPYKKTAVQLKQKPIVGIDGVQQIIGSKKHYSAADCLIITTGKFTRSA